MHAHTYLHMYLYIQNLQIFPNPKYIIEDKKDSTALTPVNPW